MNLPANVESRILEVVCALGDGIVPPEKLFPLIRLLAQLAFVEGQRQGVEEISQQLRKGLQA